MVKVMDFLAVKAGSDTDKIWKYWVEKRAPRQAAQPAVKKYCIDRVIHVEQPSGEMAAVLGDEDGRARGIWGIDEVWYDLDMQSFRAVRSALEAVPEVQKANEEWYSHFDWHALCIVEEKLMIDRTVLDDPNDKGLKSIAFHEPKAGSNNEEIWEFWKHKHGPRHLFPIDSPKIRRYCINRVTDVLEGDPHGNWGIAELWQGCPDLESFHHRMDGKPPDPDGNAWVMEWHGKFSWSPTVVTEETVVVDR